MNSQQFVDVINKVVLKSTINSVESVLKSPPGRNPGQALTTMSKWYNKLSDEDKSIVNQIIAESARTSVFGFLCVLDGARAIEDQDKGELKLYYERRDERVLLNDQNKVNLYELL